MLLRFFKSNRSVIYLFFPIIGFALWINQLIHPFVYPFYADENRLPLYQLATAPLKTPLSQTIAGLVLVILTAIIVERMNNQFAFIRIRTILAAPLYVLIAGGFPSLHALHPAYFAAVFFLLMLYRLFYAFDLRKPYSVAFDSGFLLGIASLFYLNMVVLLPVLIFSLGFLCRESRWREPVIQLTGFLLPWIFTFTWYFATSDPMILLGILENNITTWNIHSKNDFHELIFLGFLLILILIASIFMMTHFDDRKVSSRKYFIVFFISFLILAVSVVAVPSVSHELVIIMAVPVSYLMANFLVSLKSRFPGELVFSLLLIFVIAMQLADKFNLHFAVPWK